MSYFSCYVKKSKFYYLYDDISFIQIFFFRGSMASERRLVLILVNRSCTIVRNANSHILNDYNSIFVLNAIFFLFLILSLVSGLYNGFVNCICGLGRFGSQ